MRTFLGFSSDPSPQVRKHFAKAILQIKPYYEAESDVSLEIMDSLQNLLSDENPDVVEAAEVTDFSLL